MKLYRTLLFAIILLLIYPIHATSYQGALDPPATVGERNGKTIVPVLWIEASSPYTKKARKAHKEGIVALQCVVRKKGTVDRCKIIKELGYGLDESAIRTIKTKWHFKPATYEGKPIDFPVDIEVVFNIDTDNGERVGKPIVPEWVLSAEKQGTVTAQFMLGMKFLPDDGVSPDYEEAAYWFRRAAEQGHTPAQCMLGVIYTTGLGVTKDHIQAYMWFTLSIEGSKDEQAPFLQKATELSNTIVKNMTPQQIEEAQRLAREWKPVSMSIPRLIGGNGLKSSLIKHVKPEYPELARRALVQDVVVLVLKQA